jgi:putative ABC transport system substrate-binding protein
MKKKNNLLLSGCLLLATALLYSLWEKIPFVKHTASLPVIAIAQIIEHNTLDTVRSGLIDELAANGYTDKTVKIVYENAHGNVTTAAQIGDRFASLHPKVMIALSTQSAQILSSVAVSTDIPLVFTAVTNPVAARLVPSRTESTPLITGVSDYMSPEPQLEMMRTFLPTLVKLGVLYNPSEINSVSFLKEMEVVAKSQGIELVYTPINNTSEATGATLSLIGKVQALYFPNDNTAMAAVNIIADTALKQNVPVFANDSASVERGVLAAVAYDRYSMGRKTGEMVVAILKGTKPRDIPVAYDTPFDVVVNEKTLKALNLSIPESLKSIRKLAPIDESKG